MIKYWELFASISTFMTTAINLSVETNNCNAICTYHKTICNKDCNYYKEYEQKFNNNINIIKLQTYIIVFLLIIDISFKVKNSFYIKVLKEYKQ